MNNEYIIINKTDLLKRIEELIKEANRGKTIPSVNSQMAESLIKFKKYLISQSTHLMPELQKSFEAGRKLTVDGFEEEDFQDYENYISNLKLDI